MPTSNEHSLLAAVDLGSNSFKLQIARVVDEQIYSLDALKEPVRLTAGLDADKRLDAASQTRALACLSRFSERLRGLPQTAVRCVGTSALRIAENAQEFLALAEATLGYPIEIIAGREEARLVYLGVVHSLPAVKYPRLVIDIGGGSTECIIGIGMTPLMTESLHLGCVNFTQRFFPDGRITQHNLMQAEIAARTQAQSITAEYAGKWQEAVGSSGSARVINDVLVQNGWSQQDITAEGLTLLRDAMVACGHQNRLDFLGMKADRKPVFAGGVAVMIGLFAELGITHMTVAEGALREGVLYDLLGRFQHHDMRTATVNQFMRRYHVDDKQALRVADIAEMLFTLSSQHIPLTDEVREECWHYLHWSAKLHEIGFSIAHAGYHKHGAYVLAHADMPGFSQKDQMQLATLVGMQRGGPDKLRSMVLGSVTHVMVFVLRLAVLLCRNRVPIDLPEMQIRFTDQSSTLSFPDAWLDANPLTAAALAEESKIWKQVGYKFVLHQVAAPPTLGARS
ncbi:MAG: exopolyphosphatase [Betaproteobacteria bacterium]|nr:exopolyphosphatase [Betaproteobacteria bacterium]